MSDDHDQERRKSWRYDPSRRKFLKGVGVAGAGAALADHLLIGNADNVAAKISAPGEPASGTIDIVLDLNGQKRNESVERRTTVLDTIQDRPATHAARAT